MIRSPTGHIYISENRPAEETEEGIGHRINIVFRENIEISGLAEETEMSKSKSKSKHRKSQKEDARPAENTVEDVCPAKETEEDARPAKKIEEDVCPAPQGAARDRP